MNALLAASAAAPQRRHPSLPSLPKLGLGMAALGRPGYINLGHGEDLPGDRSQQAMQDHATEVMNAAYALGLRYVDCARSYGLSEAFVASWLKRLPEPDAAAVTVGSKWGSCAMVPDVTCNSL